MPGSEDNTDYNMEMVSREGVHPPNTSEELGTKKEFSQTANFPPRQQNMAVN